MRTKSMHESNLYKLPPGNLRGTTGNPQYVVQRNYEIRQNHIRV